MVLTIAFGVSVDYSHAGMVLHVDEPDSMIVGRCTKTRALIRDSLGKDQLLTPSDHPQTPSTQPSHTQQPQDHGHLGIARNERQSRLPDQVDPENTPCRNHSDRRPQIHEPVILYGFVTESSRPKSAVKEHEKRHYVTSGADHIDMSLEVACGEGILKSVYPLKAYQNCEPL